MTAEMSAVQGLLALLAHEREKSRERIEAAERETTRWQVGATWSTAAVLGETAGETFRARAVATRLAYAIAAHREAEHTPDANDADLWAVFDEVWPGLEEEWGLARFGAIKRRRR